MEGREEGSEREKAGEKKERMNNPRCANTLKEP